MPQFDITTYGSQIFWLALSFGTLFLTLNIVIIPRFKETLLKRQGLVDSDKAKAMELHARQQEQQNHRLHRLELAKDQARDLINQTVLEMDEFEDKCIQQIHEQTNQQLKDFETALEQEKKSLEKEIENLVQRSIDQLLPKLLAEK